MSPREATPTDASVIGVSERDLTRDVSAFFAAHPFERRRDALQKLPAEAFFGSFAGFARER